MLKSYEHGKNVVVTTTLYSVRIGVFNAVNTQVVLRTKIKSEILSEECDTDISFVESDDKQTAVF